TTPRAACSCDPGDSRAFAAGGTRRHCDTVRAVRTPVAAIVVVGMVNGCLYGPYQFICTDDASCGPGGKCESGYDRCSFVNPSCPNGRAFGDLSGALTGQCVVSPGGSPP